MPKSGYSKTITYLDLCTGIGGFSLGIERAAAEANKKAKCVGYSEIDKYAAKVYQAHYLNHRNKGDLTKIKPANLSPFRLLTAGFPCQPFSYAGKGRGFQDTRGTVFFSIARIIEAKRPRVVLLENVDGLLAHGNGQTFKTIISALEQLGYSIEWQVLNSKNHGVPQRRKRVFIIGYLGALPGSQVFPVGLPNQVRTRSGEAEKGIREIASTITTQSHKNGTGSHIQIANTMTARQFRSWRGNFVEQRLNQSSDGRVHHPGEVSQTLVAGHYNQPKIRVGTFRTYKHGRGLRRTQDGKAPTLQARARQDGSGMAVVQTGERIRRLTPVECERLQGFPDNWTDVVWYKGLRENKISDTQRYKMLGNAVTVNVVFFIIKRLIENGVL